MKGPTPYPRQQEAIDKMVSFVKSNSEKKGIFVYPVAFGKSIVIANVATKFPDKYFINICPNKELTLQNKKRYCSYGYEASICSASLGKKELSQVVFGTIGTLKKYLPFFKDKDVVVLVDECQNSSLKGSQLDKFIKGIKKCSVVGTTGTPVRLASGMNGTELRMMNRMRDCFYSSIEDIVQISEVIKEGRWSKLLYEVEDIDDKHLKLNTTGADYTVESLKKFSEANGLVDKAAIAVNKLIKEGRKSILVYMPFIKDAIDLEKKLSNAIAIHSDTPNIVRERGVESFLKGDLEVLINCMIYVEGFDYPELSAIVQARPTNSINQWYQSIGRLTRTHPLKKDGKIIDLSGNFNKFGKIEGLRFEDIPNYGWAMLDENENLLTNYPLVSKIRPTKQSLINASNKKRKTTRINSDFKFPWGKYKGRSLLELSKTKEAPNLLGYCSWLLKQHEKGDFKLQDSIYNPVKNYLENHAKDFTGKVNITTVKLDIPTKLF